LLKIFTRGEDVMSRRLELSVQAVLSEWELLSELFGGTEEEREKAVETLKGITSIAIGQVVDTQLHAVAQSFRSARQALKSLAENAKELAG
jgi:hypothetical protein